MTQKSGHLRDRIVQVITSEKKKRMYIIKANFDTFENKHQTENMQEKKPNLPTPQLSLETKMSTDMCVYRHGHTLI